ncbi:MAG: ferritin [Bacteroidetes bacterium]|nr:MAG: ferritin [Bacteroidota bacterium]
MISNNMQKLINDQYHRELFSAHMYFSICSYYLDKDLDGFANFFRVQAEEELMHALKQFDYLHQVDGKITYQAIDAPPTDFESIMDTFNQTLEHERYITRHIHAIVKAALEDGDFATHNFFQWFVQEQVEEEALMRTLIAKLKLIGNNKSALYLLNEELMQRKPEEATA